MDIIGLLGQLPQILQSVVVVLGALSALLVALIGVFSLIPGAEPEATLQKFVDFIAKISKK